jgi:hypothetical protein
VAVLMSQIPIEVDDTLRQEARNVGDGCDHRKWLLNRCCLVEKDEGNTYIEVARCF